MVTFCIQKRFIWQPPVITFVHVQAMKETSQLTSIRSKLCYSIRFFYWGHLLFSFSCLPTINHFWSWVWDPENKAAFSRLPSIFHMIADGNMNKTFPPDRRVKETLVTRTIKWNLLRAVFIMSGPFPNNPSGCASEIRSTVLRFGLALSWPPFWVL